MKPTHFTSTYLWARKTSFRIFLWKCAQTIQDLFFMMSSLILRDFCTKLLPLFIDQSSLTRLDPFSVLPEFFFKISGILLKSIWNFGRTFLLHFYVIIFRKKSEKSWKFLKKIQKKKIQKNFCFWKKSNFGRFRPF